jgi:hypothetical protein
MSQGYDLMDSTLPVAASEEARRSYGEQHDVRRFFALLARLDLSLALYSKYTAILMPREGIVVNLPVAALGKLFSIIQQSV